MPPLKTQRTPHKRREKVYKRRTGPSKSIEECSYEPTEVGAARTGHAWVYIHMYICVCVCIYMYDTMNTGHVYIV